MLRNPAVGLAQIRSAPPSSDTCVHMHSMITLTFSAVKSSGRGVTTAKTTMERRKKNYLLPVQMEAHVLATLAPPTFTLLTTLKYRSYLANVPNVGSMKVFFFYQAVTINDRFSSLRSGS